MLRWRLERRARPPAPGSRCGRPAPSRSLRRPSTRSSSPCRGGQRAGLGDPLAHQGRDRDLLRREDDPHGGERAEARGDQQRQAPAGRTSPRRMAKRLMLKVHGSPLPERRSRKTTTEGIVTPCPRRACVSARARRRRSASPPSRSGVVRAIRAVREGRAPRRAAAAGANSGCAARNAVDHVLVLLRLGRAGRVDERARPARTSGRQRFEQSRPGARRGAARSPAGARQRMSGWRPRVPRPRQGASSRTVSNARREGRPQARPRRPRARSARPSARRASASVRSRARARLSPATTVPPRVAEVGHAASPCRPGAAQASSDAPGRAASRRHELRALVLHVDQRPRRARSRGRPAGRARRRARRAGAASRPAAARARSASGTRGLRRKAAGGGARSARARATARRGPRRVSQRSASHARQRARGASASRVGRVAGSGSRRRALAREPPQDRVHEARPRAAPRRAPRSTDSDTAARSGTRRCRTWWAPRRRAARTGGSSCVEAAGRASGASAWSSAPRRRSVPSTSSCRNARSRGSRRLRVGRGQALGERRARRARRRAGSGRRGAGRRWPRRVSRAGRRARGAPRPRTRPRAWRCRLSGCTSSRREPRALAAGDERGPRGRPARPCRARRRRSRPSAARPQHLEPAARPASWSRPARGGSRGRGARSRPRAASSRCGRPPSG